MSLNWDARDCGDEWKALEPNRRESLIFATMFVDMGQITEANAQEFYKRMLMFNWAIGEKTYIKAGHVRAAIGLKTNVSTTTMAAFKRRIIKKLEQLADEKVIRDFKALEEEVSGAPDPA